MGRIKGPKFRRHATRLDSQHAVRAGSDRAGKPIGRGRPPRLPDPENPAPASDSSGDK